MRVDDELDRRASVEPRIAAGRFVERNDLDADHVSDLLALKTLDLKDGEPAGHATANLP